MYVVWFNYIIKISTINVVPLSGAISRFPLSTCQAVVSCLLDRASLVASASGRRHSHPLRGTRWSVLRDHQLPVPQATAADVRDLQPEIHFTYFRKTDSHRLSVSSLMRVNTTIKGAWHALFNGGNLLSILCARSIRFSASTRTFFN